MTDPDGHRGGLPLFAEAGRFSGLEYWWPGELKPADFPKRRLDRRASTEEMDRRASTEDLRRPVALPIRRCHGISMSLDGDSELHLRRGRSARSRYHGQ